MNARSRKPRETKATTVQLRLRPDEKAVLSRAAESRRTTLSQFVLQHAYEAARQVLAEETDIALRPRDWDAFQRALDRPPRSIPALRRLLNRPSVFDEPRRTAQ